MQEMKTTIYFKVKNQPEQTLTIDGVLSANSSNALRAVLDSLKIPLIIKAKPYGSGQTSHTEDLLREELQRNNVEIIRAIATPK
ncbi:hypothetical protein [Alcaligenes endophyticus]|uniref:Uncharacterized protein n=1 Tax=Alcaligenes endophyticus TaxID=1929088 RepID=A0ABT8EKL1_9BURK|nr:hypothetical protein [Alcaligenes endophyticus]MCX5592037.1 hypothetical protein [Alcaligenes endophyticus]MDN4121727.1 hypothetical protein [Alcaligenes endophyticus]